MLPQKLDFSLLRAVLRQFWVLVTVVSQTDSGLISVSCRGENHLLPIEF